MLFQTLTLTANVCFCYISCSFFKYHLFVLRRINCEVQTVKLSERSRQISPFYVMELLEKAREMEARGHRIIHMEVGEPGFQTPSAIKEEGMRSISDGKTFYTHSLGIPELREAVAKHYRDLYKIDISPERIVITNGSSGALILLFATLLERGMALSISDPGYPCYRNIALLADCTIHLLPVSSDTCYEITPEYLSSAGITPDLLVIASPSNPTGNVYRNDTLTGLYQYLSSSGGTLVVDEVYSELTYGIDFRSSLAISDNIIVVNGFSKAYSMTGWRLGWMVVPSDLVRPVQKFAQNLFISPPSVSQYAAMRAFDDMEELALMRHNYMERRDYLVPRLRELGFSVPVNPDGAFYVYAGIERFNIDSLEFSERALSEAGVALTPGYDFGSYNADTHVRFSYSDTLENLKEGCCRLERWLAGL